MNNKKIIASVIAAITIITVFSLHFVASTSENRVSDEEMYKEIGSSHSELEIMNRMSETEKKRIYDSPSDFPYESMEFADNDTFEIIKNIYDNINFYGEFEKGNAELYDYYKKKFLGLLNNTVKFKHKRRGEEYYLNEYDYFRTYNDETLNWREYNYLFFDVNGDAAPELCINDGASTYIFTYIPQTDDFALWYELHPSNYQLNGTRKIRWDGLGTGLSRVFYELDAEGNHECTVNFFFKPIYNDKTGQHDDVYMVALPKYVAHNQVDIVTTLTNQSYFASNHETYYFRVTEEQYDLLTEDYIEAYKLAEEKIKDVTFTYDELFEGCSAEKQ